MNLSIIVSLLLVVLAAVLLAAAAAKAIDAGRHRLVWPDPTLAGIRIPAGAVIAIEAVAAASVLLLAALPTAVVLAVAYGLLSIAAMRLRGRTCGCFGSRSSVVGPGHIAGTVLGCGIAVGCTVAATGWGLSVGARTAVLVALTAAVVTTMRILDARADARRRAEDARLWEPESIARAVGVVVVTKPECPHCAALRVLLHGMIDEHLMRWVELPGSHEAGSPTRLEDEQEGWARQLSTYQDMTQGLVPTAVPVDSAGRPVTGAYGAGLQIHRLVELFLQTRHRLAESSPDLMTAGRTAGYAP
ncbi:hypothetical protein [Nocardia transvalensis]|uniref:hypothetical protein n=1 Tax=Nocardia transvalensis TaxID=37333 RepID=UPI0018963192|nr:hypothetical protein [Nocardia transvalensis]MBF6331076.1 hypothetical protein [Nocardia transvalensis]